MIARIGSSSRSSKPCARLRGQHLFDCRRGRFGVAYAEQRLQHLADHHEAAAQVRLQRAGFQVLGLVVRDGADELMRDARLAETRIADHEHRLAFAVRTRRARPC